MTFIELPSFTKAVNKLVDDTSHSELQNELMAHSEKSDLIPGSGGLQKIQLRVPRRGNRAGVRVIYVFLKHHSTIVFFYLFTKAKSEYLTSDQLKRLRSAVAMIKEEFKA